MYVCRGSSCGRMGLMQSLDSGRTDNEPSRLQVQKRKYLWPLHGHRTRVVKNDAIASLSSRGPA